MNIVVTGGLGFIGSHLIETILAKTDAIVHCLDAETYAADLLFKSRYNHNSRVFFHKVDISKAEQIKFVSPYLNDIDYIIHLAAESHVDNSINGPGVFVLTNVLGTFNMLEFARQKNVKRFLHVSTDEVYGSIDSPVSLEHIFRETTILDPSSVYSSTKASSDLIVKSYFKTYNLDICITRCCNNYGPRQNKEKLLPKLIINALGHQPIPVYGNGENIREWIYVVDHCDAILTVLNRGTAGEIYNIGTGCTIENINLVKAVLKKLERDYNLITFVEDRKGHDFMYSVDSTKIKTNLDWHPKVELFNGGLDLTIDYYKNTL
jgi:dTDP-glucose 4,6-dehydratase